MNAIIACVEYSDFLSISLSCNRHHFEQVLIVTTEQDRDTQDVAASGEADIFITDSFYADGAKFNKFRALEEGLDCLGRQGWICIMDADVLWPHKIGSVYEKGNLYTPSRRMMTDLTQPIPPEDRWREFPTHRLETTNPKHFSGYSHIFHADDPVLGAAPWHQVNWRHAGGADTFFQQKWPESRRIRPQWECLHLGEPGVNWCGRVSAYLDGGTPANAAERSQSLSQLMSSRRRGNYFEAEKISLPQ